MLLVMCEVVYMVMHALGLMRRAQSFLVLLDTSTQRCVFIDIHARPSRVVLFRVCAAVDPDVAAKQAQLRAEIERETREAKEKEEAKRVQQAWTAHRSEEGQVHPPLPVSFPFIDAKVRLL